MSELEPELESPQPTLKVTRKTNADNMTKRNNVVVTHKIRATIKKYPRV